MKKLLIIIIILIGLNGYSQEVQEKLPEITETERIIDKYSEEIAKSFTNIMEQATPMAKEGFKVIVKLQIAKGIAYLFPIIFFIITFIWLMKETTKHGINDDNTFFPFACCIVFFIISLFTFYPAITHLIAPEWFAIKEIINLVK